MIVVGAGAAGLAASAQLARRGISVTLLEARQRLGGRIDTQLDPVLGIAVEHGAEFVHGHPERTLELARRARARIQEIPDRHLRRAGRRLTGGSGAFAEALARSVEGTLFFAGEATAGGHAGTVEGALCSGERAAAELLESLQGRPG